NGQQEMLLVAVDPLNTVTLPVVLKSTVLAKREVRMVQSLDVAKAHSEQKLFTVLKKGDQLKVQDITTSDVKLYDSLQKAYLLMATLSNNKTLTEFSWILEWPKLKAKERREKYSKYACHELNFFLHQKDLGFFNEVVKPYLASKKDKTFMDEWLLGVNLEKYLEPFAFSQLNDVEKILLARRGPAELEKMRRYIKDKNDLIIPNPERYSRLFDAAIMNSQLEAGRDKLGIQRGRQQAMNQLQDQLMRLGTLQQAQQEDVATGGIGGGGFANAPGAAPAPPRPTSSTVSRSASNLNSVSGRKLAEKAKKELSALKGDFDSRRTRDQFAGETKLHYEQQFKGKNNFFTDTSKKRQEVRQLFRKLPAAKEWAENNYYKLTIAQQNADLMRVNAFWNDYAASPANQPFFSGNFIYATSNFAEMMFALAVIDLPFEEPKHMAETKDRSFQLTAGEHM
ncbi:MAG TPA: hypothetical protein QF373_00910, partial [Verrucomicrobiota bacterium]|nr:hypothetical protein [Verrucomicrobiota bacterium]